MTYDQFSVNILTFLCYRIHIYIVVFPLWRHYLRFIYFNVQFYVFFSFKIFGLIFQCALFSYVLVCLSLYGGEIQCTRYCTCLVGGCTYRYYDVPGTYSLLTCTTVIPLFILTSLLKLVSFFHPSNLSHVQISYHHRSCRWRFSLRSRFVCAKEQFVSFEFEW